MEGKTVEDRKALVKSIIDAEQEMFVEVRSLDGVSPCQERLKTFRLMRWMTHSAHNDDFLKSYFQDLAKARQEGRNLMTEKYAVMDGYIPSEVTETMKFIVFSETQWMDDLKKRYSNIFKRQGGFKAYLEADLQVLSQRSLRLYYKEVLAGINAERNLVEERYENLYKLLGHNSLEEVNAKAASF